MHRDREPPHVEKTVAPLFRRWCFDRPSEDAVHIDNLSAASFCVGHNVAQKQRLGAELESRGRDEG
jgi:hypothetical protein